MAQQTSLFEPTATAGPEATELPDADLRFVPGLFDAEASERLFDELLATSAWKQDTIHMYGRRLLVPRLTAWYGERKTSYTYSNIRLEPRGWTAPLLEVQAAVEEVAGVAFNSALANLYRDGRDSVAWHADDEPELGHHPVIASVSFGATRRFDLRHDDDHTIRTSYELTPGSLLLMRGPTQHHWQHRIAKTAKPVGPRINLTFRQTTRT